MTDDLKKQLAKQCESDKKEHSDKLSLKHKEEIRNIKGQLSDDHKTKIDDLISSMTDKCDLSKREFKQ